MEKREVLWLEVLKKKYLFVVIIAIFFCIFWFLLLNNGQVVRTSPYHSYNAPFGKLILATNQSDESSSMILYRVTPKEYDMIEYFNDDSALKCRNVTTELEAPMVVQKILDNYGGLPQDAGKIRVRTQTRNYCEPDNNSGSIWPFTASNRELVRIMYERSIDGFDVVGGGYIQIELGRDGELISLKKNWRTVTPVKKVQVISVKEALNRLLSGDVLNAYPKCDCDVTVDSVRLAYLEEGYNKTQEYLEPIWIFSGSGYDYEVPALASPHMSGPPGNRIFHLVAE
jgi:hypothetical protein